MDPTKTWQEILNLLEDWNNPSYPYHHEDLLDDIASRLESLDAWYKKGGFVPDFKNIHKTPSDND